MPTRPLLSILNASEPPSPNAMVSALGKKIPVLESPVGVMDGAAVDPAATVVTPETLRLLNVEVPIVSIPAILPLPPVAVIDTVAIPEEKVAVTPVPTKLIVLAVPMVVPSSLITIPVPEATIPVSAEPSRAGSAPVSCPAGIPVRPDADPEKDDAVTTPEAFSCLTNSVVPVTVVIPAKVETPVTFRLVNVEVPNVLIPVILPPPPAAPVTVTTPAEIGDTVRLSPKSMVPAVPTTVPLSLTITPDPEPTTPVRALPSRAGSAPVSCPAGIFVRPDADPEKDVAVTIPTFKGF